MRRPGHAGAGVRFRKIRSYTLIQLGFVLCVFGLAKLPYVAVTFPLLIAVLIPFRLYVLPKFYTPEELNNLDPDPPEMPPDEPPFARTQPPTPKGEQGPAATGSRTAGVCDSDSGDYPPAHDARASSKGPAGTESV
eukprot:scaffold26470_cov160-Isochrysis_galbana.AAC.1